MSVLVLVLVLVPMPIVVLVPVPVPMPVLARLVPLALMLLPRLHMRLVLRPPLAPLIVAAARETLLLLPLPLLPPVALPLPAKWWLV
jgi:hypothetical protein